MNGDLCFWNKDGQFSSQKRHQDYIGSLISFNGDLYFSSTTKVFHINHAENGLDRVESSFKQTVKQLACNGHSWYGTDLDKVLIRFENNKEANKVTLPAVAMCLSADDAHVFVLTM